MLKLCSILYNFNNTVNVNKSCCSDYIHIGPGENEILVLVKYLVSRHFFEPSKQKISIIHSGGITTIIATVFWEQLKTELLKHKSMCVQVKTHPG